MFGRARVVSPEPIAQDWLAIGPRLRHLATGYALGEVGLLAVMTGIDRTVLGATAP